MKYLLAAILSFAVAQEPPVPPPIPQDVTKPTWIVVFEIKQKDPIKDPTVRIHVMTRGNSEGEAAIRANTYLTDQFNGQSIDKLIFIEAQEKK
jgi:hypothetical protein